MRADHSNPLQTIANHSKPLQTSPCITKQSTHSSHSKHSKQSRQLRSLGLASKSYTEFKELHPKSYAEFKELHGLHGGSFKQSRPFLMLEDVEAARCRNPASISATKNLSLPPRPHSNIATHSNLALPPSLIPPPSIPPALYIVSAIRRHSPERRLVHLVQEA